MAPVARFLSAALLAPALLSAGAAFAAPKKGGGWRLLYEETFDRPVPGGDLPWTLDPGGKESPWYAGPLDDRGEFFDVIGGPEFRRQADSFHTYRKRIVFGRDGWLTAELSSRDADKDSLPDDPPSLTTATVGGRSVGWLSEPNYHGGLLIRSTRALPPRYRVEYTLVALDFGGSRYDRWSYGGRFNGYDTKSPKTRHPWTWGPGPHFSKPHDAWDTITKRGNGFYFLGIMDYENPAPRNNVFIHVRRKVVMDTYNVVDEQAKFEVCNPVNKEYYLSQDNAVNMLFLTTATTTLAATENPPMMKTECGTAYSMEAGRKEVVSAAQLLPELMPQETYRFAVERSSTGYTLEARGNFRFVGEKTYRYHRDFIEDGRPIWHYNQTPGEYDGRFDVPWTYEGPFGKFTVEHSWPAGSAYPDYFVIGDPHTNFYEGTAAVDDLRLYVPADSPPERGGP